MVSLVKSIACLPVVGPENPYQQLMRTGLNRDKRLRAFSGVPGKFLGITLTTLKYKPNYIHFDWIVSYYYRRWRWLTYASVSLFCGQILLARFLGVKLVWTLHNLLPHDAAQAGVHRFCQRFLARHCEWVRVFALNSVQRAASELRIPTDKFRVVPEGDYTGMYPNLISQKSARERLHLPPSARVFLSLGLIKPYKGVLELIQVFRQIRQPDDFLLIVGKIMDVNYGEELRLFLSSNIILVDEFIPADELQVYFKAADLVVLPFQKIENSGSVIMAMGFAKPIIAPGSGSVAERLKTQKELLLTEQNSLQATFEKVSGYSRERLAEIGDENYRSLRLYRWEDFASCFIEK